MFEDDMAWAGDPDGPDWRVLGAYDDVDAAGRALPRPVPPGVLRPEAARFDRPALEPEVSLQELLRDITEAPAAGDVAETLLLTAQTDPDAPGPMLHLRELLHTAAEFSTAMATVQGGRLTARFDSLAHQLGCLIEHLRTAAEELGATVAVLPPHRTPRPQPQPPRPAAPGATPPAGASPRGPLPAARRR
ncbi:hypothetical protein RM572_26555 [Streptomyces sp. DSM 42041]|uniref:Uncharacterized protein n=1 Tax=Streptomyces hazeniae TaxID=3075538 RepID=A0ABU2NZB5_9ACTN|nr:hypothetical protein [Streptomyces sp. DSM 42041]MDT0382325.1 hypothetical protein [Streptomyces sp. DSM 42041]